MSVALVTGASRCIGAAIAVRLAQDGWDVAINYRSRQDAGETVVERCESGGGHAIAFPCDVSDEEEVGALFENVDEQFGPISVLVNSAGITMPISRFEDTSVATVDDLLAVNLRGTFLRARGAVKRMSTDPDRADRMGPSIPMKRAGDPEEVASLVAWLCSAEASYVTGALMDVAGGR